MLNEYFKSLIVCIWKVHDPGLDVLHSQSMCGRPCQSDKLDITISASENWWGRVPGDRRRVMRCDDEGKRVKVRRGVGVKWGRGGGVKGGGGGGETSKMGG